MKNKEWFKIAVIASLVLIFLIGVNDVLSTLNLGDIDVTEDYEAKKAVVMTFLVIIIVFFIVRMGTDICDFENDYEVDWLHLIFSISVVFAGVVGFWLVIEDVANYWYVFLIAIIIIGEVFFYYDKEKPKKASDVWFLTIKVKLSSLTKSLITILVGTLYYKTLGSVYKWVETHWLAVLILVVIPPIIYAYLWVNTKKYEKDVEKIKEKERKCPHCKCVYQYDKPKGRKLLVCDNMHCRRKFKWTTQH